MMNKMTPLFPMSVKPVQDGVYEVQDRKGALYYSYWCDDQWTNIENTPEWAFGNTLRSIACYDGIIIGWRGFTEDQNAKSVDAMKTQGEVPK